MDAVWMVTDLQPPRDLKEQRGISPMILEKLARY